MEVCTEEVFILFSLDSRRKKTLELFDDNDEEEEEDDLFGRSNPQQKSGDKLNKNVQSEPRKKVLHSILFVTLIN